MPENIGTLPGLDMKRYTWKRRMKLLFDFAMLEPVDEPAFLADNFISRAELEQIALKWARMLT